MINWNAEALSRRFLAQAVSAEQYLQEVRIKVKTNPSYQNIHDDYLARYYVFNYLHGRTFLASSNALLKELKSMAVHSTPAPREAYEQERFEHYRQQYIAQLINEFSSEYSGLS
jgi:hypothetical protein